MLGGYYADVHECCTGMGAKEHRQVGGGTGKE